MEFHDVDVSTQFKRMRELVPEAYRAFIEFDQKAFKDGALPGKTKSVMARLDSYYIPWNLGAVARGESRLRCRRVIT
ncbi:MAG: hypothetical protein ACRELW_05425 [Candidatus Rokuibacteriota bacterium]